MFLTIQRPLNASQRTLLCIHTAGGDLLKLNGIFTASALARNVVRQSRPARQPERATGDLEYDPPLMPWLVPVDRGSHFSSEASAFDDGKSTNEVRDVEPVHHFASSNSSVPGK